MFMLVEWEAGAAPQGRGTTAELDTSSGVEVAPPSEMSSSI